MKSQGKKRIGLGEFFIFRLIFISFCTLVIILAFSNFIKNVIFLHIFSITVGVLLEKVLRRMRKNVNMRGIIFFTISTIVMLIYWVVFLLRLD
ncbi:MAG: hypothetical protein COW00_13230 [Bdellovibrio sp. CG12_big_fil_rev_8_21_14_0_65_39_13]|nr:MAG: hypothetical protein COW78_11280 [Bdellovibrio sp. CG22_combo_CG10-13_8_21_14_all_39_27]PIQ58892.1 MAG: hypothetical protein COW00_13230 [Bdellovibrio sp. CG12_big_fil_rev_8_21_14_0_65_39_13]PIR35983.1 MAG: hypothetical protein COV37_05605 [Bdellovibrio sp. CG11_big_fil_rev_8_21_14_0_20_39_38]PJB53911.1 MAG: hypothetical protein CO099_04545 [Bdellovibrio sp. CG_4_9_14_3_um_filter_39_7]